MKATKFQHQETAENRWQAFAYDYIDSGWFDDDRLKTLRAMKTLCERMPQEARNDIPPDIIVFAPSPDEWGAAIPWYTPGGGPERHSQLIYLSPNLEMRPQRHVNATVAHEFAHTILGHDGTVQCGDEYRHEREADMLIQEWGYRPTNSCGWMQKEKHRIPAQPETKRSGDAGVEGLSAAEPTKRRRTFLKGRMRRKAV